MIKLKTIDDAGSLEGKKVLIRLDLNAPTQNGVVVDAYRLDKALETLNILKNKGAKIVAISHTESGEDKSLLPAFNYMNKKTPMFFSKEFFGSSVEQMISNLKNGEIVIFENLRFDIGEKENDLVFAEKLAKYGEIFVNEAFSVSHRKHASIVSIPKFLPTYFGPVFINEVENLSKAFSPKRPFLFVLGGAKFSTKMPLVKKFLGLADKIFIVGALANDIFKAKGESVGRSLVTDEQIDLSEIINNPKVFYPTDVCVLDSQNEKVFKKIDEVIDTDYIGDIGQETLNVLKEIAEESRFILWNGPTGNVEIGFKDATSDFAKHLASLKETEIIIGGGDTIASIQNLGILDRFTFVSTAGGAMLDFLANETLVGIEALQ